MSLHHIDPDGRTTHGSFDRERPPILTIDPGDTVIFRTLDSSWGKVGEPLHPFMGVMGNAPAEPGHHSTVPPRRVGGNIVNLRVTQIVNRVMGVHALLPPNAFTPGDEPASPH